MDRRAVMTIAIAAGAGVLVGALAVGVIQQQRIAELRRQLAQQSATATELASLRARIDERDRQLEQLTTQVSELESELASASPLHGTGDKTSSAPTSRQFAFIKSISSGNSPALVADYAQFLTGDAAARAAEKAGTESPPPNDYYIVNESGQLRTLRVAPSAKVRLTTKPGEGAAPEPYASDLKTLAGYLASDTEETAGLRADGFWLTVTDGVVTGIEEQYAP